MHRPDVRNAIDRKLQTVQIGITDSSRTESEELHRIVATNDLEAHSKTQSIEIMLLKLTSSDQSC